MHRWTVVVLTALLGSLLALPAAAQWKWRDANGRTQYSDTPPPPGIAEKDILQRPGGSANTVLRATPPVVLTPASAASAPPLPAPKVVDAELEAKRKQSEQEAADKKKAEEAKSAAARAENCNRAKAQMRSIESGVRLSRTNEKGEREFLDDKARAKETERTREVMTSECK
jgi:hypothetical protein